MGMFAFKLALLLCISSTICKPLQSARGLETNSSELWRKLLLTEDVEVPSPQSAPLSRRITPKSIFIVPDRDPCPPGQTLDSAGKCVRLVAVDADANRNYLLMKLKHVFSMTSRPKEADDAPKRPPEAPTPAKDVGPLQLSIPLRSNASEDIKPVTSAPKKAVTETAPEMDTESTSTDSVTEVTTLEVVTSPTEMVSEVTTEAESTTVDTARPEPTLFGELPGATFDPTRDETTTVRVYRRPGHDILKTDVRFPESTEKRNVVATDVGGRNRTSKPARPNGFKGVTDTKDGSGDVTRDAVRQHSHSAGDNSDSSISGSSFAFSNSENVGSIISFKKDTDQKLPAGERVRTKCDPLSGYNCVEVKNVASPEKGVYALSRHPFPPFVRFPGIVANSHPLIRFPHGQKAPVNVEDVISLAEANGYRHWESSRYTNPYWTPQLVRIWPENPINNVDTHNYGSRSQSVTFS